MRVHVKQLFYSNHDGNTLLDDLHKSGSGLKIAHACCRGRVQSAAGRGEHDLVRGQEVSTHQEGHLPVSAPLPARVGAAVEGVWASGQLDRRRSYM